MKKTCELCQITFDSVLIVNGKKHNLSNRKMCLSCSPFKAGNTLSADMVSRKQVGFFLCSKCKTNKEANMFYLNGDSSRKHSYCKACQSANVLDRQRLWKKKAISYKGNQCALCSYDRCDAALEFHHKDPSQKDFALSAGKLRKFESSKAELDKCVLVCSNCHREIHLGLVQCPE